MPDMMFEYGGMMYTSFRQMGSMMYFSHPYEDAENLFYQNGLNYMSPQAALVRKPVLDLFDKKTDLRYTFCIGTSGKLPATAESGSGMFNNMFFRWNCAGIKLSEAYLTVAECYARKGDKDNAVKYVNDLRKNRHIRKYYTDLAAADATEAMKIVREEQQQRTAVHQQRLFRYAPFLHRVQRDADTRIRRQDLYADTGVASAHVPVPVVAMQNSHLIQNSK